MNNVRSTSREAFHSLRNLPKSRAEVLDTIKRYGPMCDLDIAMKLNKPINRINPRRGELVDGNEIVESHRAVHPITGKRVIYWKVNPTPKPTIKDQCDELMRGVESFQLSLKGIPDFNQPELDF